MKKIIFLTILLFPFSANSSEIDNAISNADTCYSEFMEQVMRTGVKSVSFTSCRAATEYANSGKISSAPKNKASIFYQKFRKIVKIAN